jgi:hypothetical protein
MDPAEIRLTRRRDKSPSICRVNKKIGENFPDTMFKEMYYCLSKVFDYRDGNHKE